MKGLGVRQGPDELEEEEEEEEELPGQALKARLLGLHK